MKGRLIAGLILFSTPTFVFASVRVTEVMYDLPGSDAGREWVEVINDGADIDLKDYKFFNKEGGHLLKAYGSGTTLLASGGVVVIADKPDLFLIDWPQYAGLLIDSSFSLVSSDTVGIKDSEGTVVHSVSYTSDMGAKGDGNSLHFSSSAPLAAVPTPGTTASSPSAAATAPVQTTATSSSTSSSGDSTSGTSASSSKKPEVPIKRITVDAGGDRTVTVGAAMLFTAKVYGTAGEPVLNPRLMWNFGNGESKEGQSVMFTYEIPGTYNLVVTGATGEYSASDRVLIEAAPAAVSLEAETDGTLSLLNKEKRDLDVSLWMLARGGKSFRIPANTVISGGKRVPFSTTTTGLPPSGEPELMYPNGTLVGVGQVSLEQKSAASTLLAAAASFIGPKQKVSKASPKPAGEALAEAPSAPIQESGSNVLWWLLGALGLGVLGAASVLFMRASVTEEGGKPSVSTVADTYEIIE